MTEQEQVSDLEQVMDLEALELDQAAAPHRRHSDHALNQLRSIRMMIPRLFRLSLPVQSDQAVPKNLPHLEHHLTHPQSQARLKGRRREVHEVWLSDAASRPS
jgi:hypothetical protein